MRTLRGCLLVVALLGATDVKNARAECIVVARSPAERLASAQLVFVGDVLKIETVILDPEPFVYRVRFRVRQAYKGTDVGEQTFDFQATAEDVRFQDGQRVLVYAHRNSRGKFSTQCTATRGATLDDPEVAVLRQLSAAR